MIKKRVSALILAVLLLVLLAACTETGGDGASSGPIPPAQMDTDALRAGLAGGALSAAERQQYYEELLARDLFTEQDYLDLAQLYADAGDTAAQRRMLWQALHLYPSDAYAERLERLIVERDASSAEAAALIASLKQALEERSASALRMLVASGDWRSVMQEAPEMFTTRTRYRDTALTAQIVSDDFETTVCLLDGGGGYLYGRVNEAGALIASAQYTGGAYEGAAAVRWFDAQDELYKDYAVTLQGNVCVGELTVTYDGVTYTGTLDENGKSTEKQQTNANGVVYAYQNGGNKYLYLEGVTEEDFRLDCTAIGLPAAEIW